jgi:Cu+-exporting ATPase
VAIESDEIAQMIRDDLMDAVSPVQLSKKVMVRIKQNLFWALRTTPRSSPGLQGCSIPSLALRFDPSLQGLAMALSSVTVVTLSLMLKRCIPPAK